MMNYLEEELSLIHIQMCIRDSARITDGGGICDHWTVIESEIVGTY